MKRHGQLMEAIAEPANLRLAFWKAAKSKRAKADCRAFQQKLAENLAALRGELLSSSVELQLEQQRQQRAERQPQQQQPGERQQHWFPGCPAPSSIREPEDSLADPAAVPSPHEVIRGKEAPQRPGVSSREHSTKAPDLSFPTTQSNPAIP